MVWKTILEKLVWPLVIAALMGLGAAFSGVRDLARENSILVAGIDRRLGGLESAMVDDDNRYTQTEADKHHRDAERRRSELRAYIREVERDVIDIRRHGGNGSMETLK